MTVISVFGFLKDMPVFKKEIYKPDKINHRDPNVLAVIREEAQEAFGIPNEYSCSLVLHDDATSLKNVKEFVNSGGYYILEAVNPKTKENFAFSADQKALLGLSADVLKPLESFKGEYQVKLLAFQRQVDTLMKRNEELTSNLNETMTRLDATTAKLDATTADLKEHNSKMARIINAFKSHLITQNAQNQLLIDSLE